MGSCKPGDDVWKEKQQGSPPGQKQVRPSTCKCERESSSCRNCTHFKEKEKTKPTNKSRVESAISSMRQPEQKRRARIQKYHLTPFLQI